MKIGALTLFGPIHSNHEPLRGRVLAAWHLKKSITWRWGLNWMPRAKQMPLGFFRWGNAEHPHFLLRLPLLGEISFAMQPNLFPKTYPLRGFPLRQVRQRRTAIEHEQCPDCGGWLDVGNECNECQYEAWRELQPMQIVKSESPKEP